MTILSRIDTRWGTYNSHAYSNGNCLPLTASPWGMNAFCLQTTDNNGNWFFNPYEPIYQGIRLTHQPSPWLGDFSSLLITPVTGDLSRSSLFHRQSSYQVDTAVFRPDLLQVTSNRYQVTSQLTPTCYGANCRFDSQDKSLGLVFFAPDWSSFILKDDYHLSIELHNASDSQATPLRFFIELSSNQPIHHLSKLEENQQNFGQVFAGDDQHIRFDVEGQQLEIKFATSYISAEQAKFQLSLIDEFDNSLAQVQEDWNYLLSRVEIDEEKAEKDFFYHCLYRTLLFPQTFHEITPQGQFVHLDTLSGKIKPGRYYTNNGYWDTFRSTYPLYSILYPDFYEHFLEGILNHYKDTGFLPKWLSPDERGIMPGTLVDGVIADATSKGLGKHLLPELLEAMLTTRNTEDKNQCYGRHGAHDYQTLGYLPYEDYHESVSHSLDYAYSDWCIAQVARLLGKDDLAEELEQASLSYRQLFDPESGYIRAKDKQGNFRQDFSPYAWGRDYAECSAIQATLGVLHDMDGLMDMMGGQEAFTDYLTQLITDKPLFDCQHYGYEIHEMSEMAQVELGQLAISNQPSFHIPYLFQLSQLPEKTGDLIETIRQQYFKNDVKAYPGDEDNGSLSAWYIFSCLGFYPICPGKPVYHFGRPAFKESRLRLPSGIFTIRSQQTGEEQGVYLDRESIHILNHQDLMKARDLNFSRLL